MFLDDMTPKNYEINHFNIGTHGYTGMPDIYINHNNMFFYNAIGAHAPSVVEYELNRKYNSFSCKVGINKIEFSCNPVDFLVYVDNNLMAHVPGVDNLTELQDIKININKAKNLKLVTKVADEKNNDWCHSVWYLAQVFEEKITNIVCDPVYDNIYINLPKNILKAPTCIYTIYNSYNTEEELINLSNLFNNSFLFVFNNSEQNIAKLSNIKCVEIFNKTKDSVSNNFLQYLIQYFVLSSKYLYINLDILKNINKKILKIFDIMDMFDNNQILCIKNQQNDIFASKREGLFFMEHYIKTSQSKPGNILNDIIKLYNNKFVLINQF